MKFPWLQQVWRTLLVKTDRKFLFQFYQLQMILSVDSKSINMIEWLPFFHTTCSCHLWPYRLEQIQIIATYLHSTPSCHMMQLNQKYAPLFLVLFCIQFCRHFNYGEAIYEWTFRLIDNIDEEKLQMINNNCEQQIPSVTVTFRSSKILTSLKFEIFIVKR